jgi:hypothetical protein
MSYKNAKYNARNREFVQNYLVGEVCVCCGEGDIRKLEFDHIDRSTKKNTISRLVHTTHSLESIKKEIAKCEVLCANCHRVRTHNEREEGKLNAEK